MRTVAEGQALSAEAVAAIVDGQRTVETRLDVDADAGIAAAVGAGGELQEAAVEREGVVVADGALVLKAADTIEIRWGGLPGGLGILGRLREAGVVAWQIALEEALGLVEGAGLGEAQFGDEAILKGAEEPFDPALALGRGGGDPADTQFVKGAADLRGGDRLGELLGERRRAGGAMKETVAVGVGGDGDAIAPDELAEQEQVPARVFFGAKDAA